MGTELSDDDLLGIAARLAAAHATAKPPWRPHLETREPLGGTSFVALNVRAPEDDELYVSLSIADRQVRSPDAHLDAVIDFIGHAPDDIARLLAEVRRLRSGTSRDARV